MALHQSRMQFGLVLVPPRRQRFCSSHQVDPHIDDELHKDSPHLYIPISVPSGQAGATFQTQQSPQILLKIQRISDLKRLELDYSTPILFNFDSGVPIPYTHF